MKEMKVKKIRPGAILPKRATGGSAGYDLSAAVDGPVTVAPGETAAIPTGIAIQLEPGYAALVFGRSGLGMKNGVAPTNAVGVVDSDYRGELTVGLTCHHTAPYTIRPGERIAQMVIVPVATPLLIEAEELEATDRGTGGFGSTGK